ncbi:MAG: MFS transporter [Acidimicrobiales bacterium]
MTQSTSLEHHGDAAQSARRPGVMLVLLSLAQFMVILDVTVVNVALPDIGSSLQLDREMLTWVVTAYTMTLGGLLILGGRLADAIGARAIFMVGLTVFSVASLSSGLATNGELLLASRAAQGLGAAMLSPAALSLLMRVFTGRERDRALAVWGAIGGAGAAAGVLVGGALTSGPGWQWAFFVNVPVGLLVLLALPLNVPSLPRQGAGGIDLPGALAGTAAIALGIYGLTKAGDAGWTSTGALLPVVGAVLAAGLFVLIETRSGRPLVPPALMRRTSLPGGLMVMITASATMVSAYFLTSLFLQRAHGFSPLETGLTFLPSAVAVAAGAHAAGHAVTRLGPRMTGGTGLALAGLGLVVMGGASSGDRNALTTLIAGLLAASVGIGMAFVTSTISGLSGIGHRHAGVASGVLTTGHELGASLGVAVVSSLAAASLVGTDAAGFERAYLVAGVATLVIAGAAARLLPRERPTAENLPKSVH